MILFVYLPLRRPSKFILFISMQCGLMHINKAHEIKIVTVNRSLQNTTVFSNTVLLKAVVPGPAA